ncbi:MAG: terminase large subunit [Phycisphaerae bacterium]|nr:terminase large subunit [Phycisphaerae bacterium]NUQ10609.1 terminase large subunit [Phycisphaerae bacterium]
MSDRKPRRRARTSSRRAKARLFPSAPSPLESLCRRLPGYDPFLFPADSVFDPKAAQRALDFFEECLTFTAGEWMGRPFKLQAWQQAVVANVFGWKRPNGYRRYREAFIYVPRKSGKSTLAGGLGNFLTFADGEPGAQVYCAAADREQARLVFNAARTMVLAEPELAGRSRIYTNAIMVPATGSMLKVVSAEAYTKHGVNAHGVIIDELHAQPDRELVDVLTTSTGARRQPLIIYITTADYDRPSICNEKYDYACKVRDGIIDDPAFLPVVYEAQRDEDWADPCVWAKANPNLGVSLSPEYMERECARARETPTYENTFKRLHLNMKTQQDVRWLSLEPWDACAGPPIDEESLRGRDCCAGLDLSTTTDVTAFVMVFPDEDGGITVLPKFWIPAENARKRERRDRVPYETWARQGLIEETAGNVVDYEVIRQRIGEWREMFNIREVAIDPWNATHITTQLQSDGIPVVTFGQGFRDMTAPTKEWEKLILCRKLRHGGNPVLRWMASNVSVETDAAGNIKPSKKKSTERIDGIVAGIMALGRLGMTQPGWDGQVLFMT